MEAKSIKQPPSDDKLGELIVYISRLSQSDDAFGATKLNKSLFYSDLMAYLYLGRSITGQEYQKLSFGPAPRRLLPVRNRLTEQKAIVVERVDYHTYKQDRVIALREPDLTMFSPDEIDIVNQVVRHFQDHTATAVSLISHRFVGWRVAADGETLPLELALIDKRDLLPDEIAYGRSLEDHARKCLERDGRPS